MGAVSEEMFMQLGFEQGVARAGGGLCLVGVLLMLNFVLFN